MQSFVWHMYSIPRLVHSVFHSELFPFLRDSHNHSKPQITEPTPSTAKQLQLHLSL